MKTLILTLLALGLAIPTYGISLIIWLIIKNKYDSFVVRRVLINAAVMSYKYGHQEIRFGINNAALTMLFTYFQGIIITNNTSFVTGLLPHPISGEYMFVSLQQVSGNRLVISASDVDT